MSLAAPERAFTACLKTVMLPEAALVPMASCGEPTAMWLGEPVTEVPSRSPASPVPGTAGLSWPIATLTLPRR